MSQILQDKEKGGASVKFPSNTLKKVRKDEFFAKKLSHLPKL